MEMCGKTRHLGMREREKKQGRLSGIGVPELLVVPFLEKAEGGWAAVGDMCKSTL